MNFDRAYSFCMRSALPVVVLLCCVATAAETPFDIVPAPRELKVSEGAYKAPPDFFCGLESKWTKDDLLPSEGYRIDVTPQGVSIAAADAAGAFYAVETLKQLVPTNDLGQTHYRISWLCKQVSPTTRIFPGVSKAGVEIYAQIRAAAKTGFTIPCVSIRDWPEYPWRGVMLDTGRNYQSKDATLKLLDLMARFKFNVFQMHFTEDQGWRLEIPSMPELVKYGSVRPKSIRFATGITYPEGFDGPGVWEYDDEPNGPFYYRPQDIAEICAYAKARHIKVVPEIEMPGHCRAFLAAYPEFSCRGAELPRVPRSAIGIEKEVLCVGNDAAVRKLEEIFDYVCRVFPDSDIIHVGGDECQTDRWKTCPKCQARMKKEGLKNERELQSWIVRHFSDYMKARGRRIMGWDGILNGHELDVDQTVVHFRQPRPGCRAKTAAEAAALGHDVVYGPTEYTFCNRSQGIEDDPHFYRHWASDPVTAEMMYWFDPRKGCAAGDRKRIIGSQLNGFGGFTTGRADMEWKFWPRGCAMAESLWCGEAKPGYEDFFRRMKPIRREMIAEHVNCARLSEPVGRQEQRTVDQSQAEGWRAFMPDL